MHASKHFCEVARKRNEPFKSCRGALFTLRPPRLILGRVGGRRVPKRLVRSTPARAPAQNFWFSVRARKMVRFGSSRFEIFLRAFARVQMALSNTIYRLARRAFSTRDGAEACAVFAKDHWMVEQRLGGAGACVGVAASPFRVHFRVLRMLDRYTIPCHSEFLCAPSDSR